ncbi:hypothetical protein CHH28_13015 [Bacterioplanes sanyensis]|uniref:HEAT repeat domain-containing protein n=1 Tax=Bacterioplanes sanyensis TaxID=1249553 RepID=A0A222FKJ9_9GAMM|nr:hypothetical protein [Bacterioplanes sanyensis]ASP39538.1 hypothetical protein CHH28_13015 [Bacterioplanes sanyensis]
MNAITAGLAVVWLALTSLQARGSSDCQPQYDLQVDTRTRTTLTSPLPNAVKMTARLSLKPVEHHEQTGWWALKADELTLRSQGQQAVDTDYEHAFAFRVDGDGQIRQFWFAKGTPETAKDKLQSLAYYFQYRDERATSVQQEQDMLGNYDARYQWRAPTLLLEKDRYQLHASSAGNAFKALEILQSQHAVTPTSCWFSLRQGEEGLQFIGHSEELNFTSRQRYQLTMAEQYSPTALSQMPVKLADWPAVSKPEQILTLEQQRAKLVSWLDTDKLLALDGFSLANELRQLDAALLELPALIAEGQLSDEAMMRLFNALGQVDTDHSQYVLMQFLLNGDSSETQFRALRALANGEQPLGDSAYWAIKSVMDDAALLADDAMRGSFYMTLGIMLAERRGNENSELLHQDLATALQQAEDETNQSNLITALGNSADDRHTAQIKRYRDHASARLQRASARAFGGIASQQAYGQLQAMLATSELRQAPVTRAVIKSLANFELESATLNQVYGFARDAKEDSVRYQAIKTIGQQHAPQMQSQLRELLPQESSRRNFRAIVQALHADN